VSAAEADIPQAVAESEMDFLGLKVRVYVLADGRRVIEKGDFERAMAIVLEGDSAGEGR
jgi:hypothetical protein